METLVRIQETLENAGIVFISADQQGDLVFGCATYLRVKESEDGSGRWNSSRDGGGMFC